MNTSYLLAFTTGLLGGFGHCIGMCGPVVASYTLSSPTDVRFLPHMLYNAGRIATYVTIGGLMGFTGSFINTAGSLAGIQHTISFLAGILMVLMGLGIAGVLPGAGWLERHNRFILSLAGRVRGIDPRIGHLALGLVLGLLPCGLSYTMLLAAAGTGAMLPGMLTMLLFGLGTLPAMFGFGVLISAINAAVRNRLYRAGGIAVIIMGIYFIYAGYRLHAGL